jgi:uncharacterized integral membrane protein
MFVWIKFILVSAVLLAVLLLGVEFTTLNADLVTVNFLYGSMKQPLSLVVISAFATGVLVTLFIGMFIVLPLRWQLSRLRQTVSSKEQEINLLAKKVGQAR